jgi:hypothetical protein
MQAIAAQSLRRRLGLMLTVLVLVPPVCGLGVSRAFAQPAPKPILAPPSLLWDNAMLSARPALSQTVTDFAAITGGIVFGMEPADANALLPVPASGITWTVLPPATEFQDDIRYFWTRLEGASDLRAGSTACVGASSYIVFLFQARGLFRISYRLIPDAACPRPGDAASEIFGRYVPITRSIALSVHYRVGAMEVVDITDPTAGYLTTVRWQPRGK